MPTSTPLEPVLHPVETARGLSNAHYVDAGVFEEEKQAIWFQNWAGLGFGRDVPEAGDAKPVTFMGVPLVMIRDHDGALRVFQNTCRHRGMILIDSPKKIQGAIRCPYHSWCYALNGDLRSTPHVGGPGLNQHADIHREDLGLIEVRSHVWQDIVFVNISGTAPDFTLAHARLLTRWQDFDVPLSHGGAGSSFQLEVKTNWKLAVENYCESYHLPWVHPGLNSYSRLEDHYNIEEPRQFSGQGTRVYKQLKGDDAQVLPDLGDKPATWGEKAEYVSLYPNVLLGVHRDHVFAILLQAQDHEHTIERVEIYYAASAVHAGFDELRARNAALWKSVFEEDIFVVEGMQRGRHGVLFDGGKFSPVMDRPTHCFHHWVATQLSNRRATVE